VKGKAVYHKKHYPKLIGGLEKSSRHRLFPPLKCLGYAVSAYSKIPKVALYKIILGYALRAQLLGMRSNE
jgi:hypothetical protein